MMAPGGLYTTLAREILINAQLAARALDNHARVHFTGAAHGILLALLALRGDEPGVHERQAVSQAWLVLWIAEETARVTEARIEKLRRRQERRKR